jgi:hypothetical protein
MPEVLPAAYRAQGRSATLTVGGVAAAGQPRDAGRWPPPPFYIARRDGAHQLGLSWGAPDQGASVR